MRAYRFLVVGLLLLLVSAPLIAAQEQHDPLNDQEVDELRETALEPEKRVSFFIEFARARLEAAEQASSNPKLSDRGVRVHDRLADFSDIYDELEDNVDNYADRHDDLRKTLRALIDADTEFAARLRALKNSANVPPQVSQQYQFVLDDAIEAVDDAAPDHRQLLAQQEEAAKEKKKEKH